MLRTTMSQLRVELHPKQTEVFNDQHRFKVVAAGRRFGKSRLAAWTLIIEALKSQNKDVFYVAPTFQQAKDIMWTVLKELAHSVIKSVHENTAVITLINDRKIYLKGSDRPDTMRGVGLAYVVIDEYADMKPQVFEQILRPALSDVKGGALFIGTPKGRNHFYELYQMAQKDEDSDWVSFHFTSFDNPLLDPTEIEAAKKSMSSFSFRQEYLASFEAAQSDLFKEDWLRYVEKDDIPSDGQYYIAVDLAGFEDVSKQAGNKKKHLDESAIAVVKICEDGWYVDTIVSGRWDIKETANKILDTAKIYDVRLVGIERGMAKNAVLPYMQDLMKRKNYFISVIDLTHGNKKKTDRIVWALQGRFEHGRIKLVRGEWNKQFVDQLLNFPNTQIHDDLIDALAYIDQIGITEFGGMFEEEEYEVLDPISGY
jgi:predicted phage terminase large subunit-like protein